MNVREQLTEALGPFVWQTIHGHPAVTVVAALDVLTPLVDRLRAEAAATELETFAAWNDEQPDSRISRGVVASVCRDRADRCRARAALLRSQSRTDSKGDQA